MQLEVHNYKTDTTQHKLRKSRHLCNTTQHMQRLQRKATFKHNSTDATER